MKQSTYKFGYEEYFVKLLRLRNAANNAAFLLPYLTPNLHLLDCGCGPGSITCDFAQILSDGKVIGIDFSGPQLKMARTEADARHLSNIEFQNADVFKLPFENNTFDVVFSHALIGQMANTVTAIKEMLRVTKPGGIVAARTPSLESMLIYPETPILLEAHDFRLKMINKDGVDCCIGRKLRSLFAQAGCKKTIGSASCESYGTEKEIRQISNYIANELTNLPYSKHLAEQQLLYPKEQIAGYQHAWKEFSKVPDAFLTCTWCEVIGFK